MTKNLFLKDFSALPEDVLIENERGITLLGYPLFSPKILLTPFDPPQFQRLNTENGLLIPLSKNTISNFIELYPIDLSTDPVSYTHLDVYKRQERFKLLQNNLIFESFVLVLTNLLLAASSLSLIHI